MNDSRPDRYSWLFNGPGQPLGRVPEAGRPPGPGETLIQVAGCGLCHTDLSFYEGIVNTKKEPPLVLGHEISGTVVEAGEGAENLVGKAVLVAAVIPCGVCEMCLSGRANVCFNQVLPGNDMDGGFASHVTVPARGLTVIDTIPDGHELADLAVIADAVTTPLQAVRRAGVMAGDFVVVVGVGGVGTYAAQIAAASGGTVVGVDIDDSRLEALVRHGGAVGKVNSRGLNPREVRDLLRGIASEHGLGPNGWKILECSGTAPGQETAFGLLCPGATLMVVGFTMDRVTIRLSNLMAFDAQAIGSWGCPPERYPEAIELVTAGKVQLLPFTRRLPLDDIEAAIAGAHASTDPRRTILIP